MSGLTNGSNAELSKNEFNSGSSYSIHSKQASQSYNDLNRVQTGKTKQLYASDYSNRLPSIIFSGPNGVYNRRVGQYDYKGEIGIGKASGLRSLNSEYITRGTSGTLMNARRHIPNEIGWSVSYFQNLYPSSVSNRYPGLRAIPR